MEEKQNQSKYIAKFVKEHYDRIELRYPKKQQYRERIKRLADGEGKSINQWILQVIDNELMKAGV